MSHDRLTKLGDSSLSAPQTQLWVCWLFTRQKMVPAPGQCQGECVRLLRRSVAELELESGEILKEHARYSEFMQRRVDGLEAAISERDSNERNPLILSLKQKISERDSQIVELNKAIDDLFNSYSWRLTAPLRKAKSLVEIARQQMKLPCLNGRTGRPN
jgi:hypothetical protein